MTTNTIEPTIFASIHPQVVKRISLRKLLFSFSMLFLGCILFLGVFMITDKSSTLSMACMVAGSVFLLLGIFRLFWKSQDLFYSPTGSVVSQACFFFHLKDLSTLSQVIADKQFGGCNDISTLDSGNVRLDALLSNDHRFVALQLFQFVPYTYTPVTSVLYFTDDDARSVSVFLKHCSEHA